MAVRTNPPRTNRVVLPDWSQVSGFGLRLLCIVVVHCNFVRVVRHDAILHCGDRESMHDEDRARRPYTITCGSESDAGPLEAAWDNRDAMLLACDDVHLAADDH